MQTLGTMLAASTGSPEGVHADRRRRTRYRIHNPAYATLATASKGIDLNEILDINEDGMSIQTAAQLPAGRGVKLQLDLSGSQNHINTTGLVIWSNPSGRAGIQFPQMPESVVRDLREWIFSGTLAACVNGTSLLVPREKAGVLGEEAKLPGKPNHIEQKEPKAVAATEAASALIATVRKEVEQAGYDLTAALQLIAERARTFTRAMGAALALSDGNEMVCHAMAGSHAPAPGARLQLGSGFSAACVRSGTLLSCEDSETDPRVDRATCRAFGIRSMMAAPVRGRERVLGLLEVFSTQPGAFQESDSATLAGLAGLVPATLSRALQRPLPQVPASSTIAPSQPHVTPARAPRDAVPASRFLRNLVMAVAATCAVLFLSLLAAWTMGWVGTPIAESSQAQIVSSVPAGAISENSTLATVRRLAEKGDPAAQFAMGAHYATGEDVKQDYSEAVRWFSLAAQQGHVAAQATLGAYYWAGRGVPQDFSKAYFWSVLARTGGDEASKDLVTVLASRMTRSQIIAAQQKANDWLAGHTLGASR